MVSRLSQRANALLSVLAFLFFLTGFPINAAVSVEVPGTSNPWLAGMPDDTSSGRRPDWDYAPENSPVLVPGLALAPDQVLLFKASGAVNKGPGWPMAGPDGDLREIAGKVVGSEYGIADLRVPKNALVGVFLGPEEPDLSPAPEGLSFGSTLSREFFELRPKLKQPFFIGDGVTSFGESQKFVVPEGATRLYLGTMDGVGWYNNDGSFGVIVTIDPPEVVVPPNQPPKVSLTSPVNSQTFPFGADVQIVATASDTDGSISKIEFFGDGISIGNTSIQPYITNWQGLEPGEHFVFAEATDDLGSRVTSGMVTISVAKPIPVPPTVVLSAPRNGTVFPEGLSIRVAAQADDRDGTIQKVDFYSDSKWIGSRTQPPYEILWQNAAAGLHVLTARATDDANIGVTSDPVAVDIRDLSGDVAIVRSVDDEEVAALRVDLEELGFSVRLLDPRGITFEWLQRFKLIIWDAVGQSSQSLNDLNLSALTRSFEAGIPLYFIGETIVSAADHLSPAAQSKWFDLTHLSAASEAGDRLDFEFIPSDTAHPVVLGRFGIVESFRYPATLAVTAKADGTVDVLGYSGNSDVLVAYPARAAHEEEGPRSITQSFPVDQGDDESAKKERKDLFQNAICWLLRCAPCDSVNIWLEATAPIGVRTTGESMTYTARISHSGECEANGVVVTHTLSAGLMFVGVESDLGEWSLNGQVLRFQFGHLKNASQSEMRVRVTPISPGTHSIHVESRLNGPEVTLADNSADVAIAATGENLPVLEIGRASVTGLELRMIGGAGKRYNIEASADFEAWVKAAEAEGGSWSKPLGDFQSQGSHLRFFRAVEQ